MLFRMMWKTLFLARDLLHVFQFCKQVAGLWAIGLLRRGKKTTLGVSYTLLLGWCALLLADIIYCVYRKYVTEIKYFEGHYSSFLTESI